MVKLNKILISFILIATLFEISSSAQTAKKRNSNKIPSASKSVLTNNKEKSELSGWILYRNNKGLFSILSPTPFTEQNNSSSNHYIALTPDHTFQILYTPSGIAPEKEDWSEFSNLAVALIEERMLANGIVILSRFRDTKSSYFWEFWNPTPEMNKFIHVYNRTIINKGIIYDLQCASRIPNQKADRKICQKFLNSMETR